MIALFAVATLVLSGHVVDQTTGQGLAGVALRAGAAHTKTDASGAYKLRGLVPGKISIVLESDDVPPQHFDLVLSGTKAHHDFTACSTTLDYSCAPQLPLPGTGVVGAGDIRFGG